MIKVECLKSTTAKLLLFPAFVLVLASVLNAAPAPAKETVPGLELLDQFQNALVEIAEKVKPSVVNISPVTQPSSPSVKRPPSRRSPDRPSTGSGVVLHPDGYIVTNNHVIGDAEEVEIRFSDKTRLRGKVIGRDPDTDLAVIKIDPQKPISAVPMGNSDDLRVGQWVMAVGNPFGLDRTVTLGVISGLGREGVNLSRYEDFIQTDASINPGNSGGPLFNLKGEVVGINTAIINFAQGIGFAIPTHIVKPVMDQLIEYGKVTRGWLGVGIQQLTIELASKFKVAEDNGVLVNEVFKDDPAERAGIRPGDVILKIDNRIVENPSFLAKIIAGYRPGDQAQVAIIRDGKQQIIPVILGEKKDQATVASLQQEPKSLLGIDVQDLTPELAERFELRDEKGVLINKILEGSPAAEADLKEGDLIKEINRESINSVDDFNQATTTIKTGENVLVRIVRESRAFYVVLKTPPGPE